MIVSVPHTNQTHESLDKRSIVSSMEQRLVATSDVSEEGLRREVLFEENLKSAVLSVDHLMTKNQFIATKTPTAECPGLCLLSASSSPHFHTRSQAS